MTVDSVLTLHRELDVHTGRIAELFLALFRDDIWAAHVSGVPASDGPRIQHAVEGLQPVATLALLSSFRSLMQARMDAFIRQISDDLAPGDAPRDPGRT